METSTSTSENCTSSDITLSADLVQLNVTGIMLRSALIALNSSAVDTGLQDANDTTEEAAGYCAGAEDDWSLDRVMDREREEAERVFSVRFENHLGLAVRIEVPQSTLTDLILDSGSGNGLRTETGAGAGAEYRGRIDVTTGLMDVRQVPTDGKTVTVHVEGAVRPLVCINDSFLPSSSYVHFFPRI